MELHVFSSHPRLGLEFETVVMPLMQAVWPLNYSEFNNYSCSQLIGRLQSVHWPAMAAVRSNAGVLFVLLPTAIVAMSAQIAAIDSHTPGMALFLVK